MKCQKCGYTNNPEALICNLCGDILHRKDETGVRGKTAESNKEFLDKAAKTEVESIVPDKGAGPDPELGSGRAACESLLTSVSARVELGTGPVAVACVTLWC